ncbi:PepSY domain-containing protein [Microbulbifer sp. ANSA005]|uniref:PepSY domain-containing protein n=1 Tax=Microbulbifer sp. ANSA005 TaxID=3243362 RepID=UPI0040432107
MKLQFIRWHRFLTWIAFFGVVTWSLSGISHPIMAWFGPQAKNTMPPTFQASTETLYKLEKIVDKLPIERAAIAKVVPSSEGNLLQITEADNSPRRYFNLETGSELFDHDIAQAKWLTSHYLDLPQENIIDVKFKESFSADYPRVNRLLPVYEVTIAVDDNLLKAFIYTETGALAALNNSFKAKTQMFFRALHTWSWLDTTGHGRVLTVALFMLTLLVIASTGLYLIFALPSRKIPKSNRRWHRRLGYLLWLPLLGWSASGFYHLLQAEYIQPISGLRLLEPVQLESFAVTEREMAQWRHSIESSIPKKAHLNAISLNQSIDKKPFYRLGISIPIEESMSNYQQRKARFSGLPLESSSALINAQTGEKESIKDQDLAKELALQFIQSNGNTIDNIKIDEIKLVTHFGPNYDFRNKRLPVWQVDLNDPANSRYFVDPVTGILVDQNRKIDRLESLSFSLLHKWNFLRPLIGAEKRDILIVITLLALVAMSCFGLAIYLARRKPRARRVGSSLPPQEASGYIKASN